MNFINKIVNIRDQIYHVQLTPGITLVSTATLESAVSAGSYLGCFFPIDIYELSSVVSHSVISVLLDPIPYKVFKEVLPIIGSVISDLVYASLLTGYVPRAFKIAVNKPLLKKTSGS